MLKREFCPTELLTKSIKSKVEDIPKLRHNLDRVLFNPGVYYLRDPRTGNFNFDPFLHKLPQPQEFNFNLLRKFVPASQDEALHQLASKDKCQFVSSTSAISASMGTIYHFLNKSRPLHLDHVLTMAFSDEPKSLTALTRAPVGIVLRKHPSFPMIYSIMAEKPPDEPQTILSKLGHLMEKMLTEVPEKFSQYLLSNKGPQSALSRRESAPFPEGEVYNYSQYGKILLRSQIDCQNDKLPKKTFDLKTRASLPIRMDVVNYHRYLDYKVSTLHGLYESYEREFYDMCRSTMLKYNFQVRIGDMDGIFVAYHNTAEIFGFQYISREAMDTCLYGSSNSGDAAFSLIMQIYNELLQLAKDHFSTNDTIKLTFVLGKDVPNKLTIYISDDQEKDVMAFTMTGTLTNRGLRQDHLELSASQSLSDVKMHLAIIPTSKINYTEYNAARAKVLEANKGNGGGFDDRMPEINDKVMRMIMERSQPKNIYF